MLDDHVNELELRYPGLVEPGDDAKETKDACIDWPDDAQAENQARIVVLYADLFG